MSLILGLCSFRKAAPYFAYLIRTLRGMKQSELKEGKAFGRRAGRRAGQAGKLMLMDGASARADADGFDRQGGNERNRVLE